ncbi:MAG TPA: hypothetical protein VET51_04045 [Burkholderiales bacterium]|nr:hypothetical protein [Burkholderiales bacterium]
MKISRLRRLAVAGSVGAALSFGVASATAVVNLVPNGDFELDNLLFSSDYAYTPA